MTKHELENLLLSLDVPVNEGVLEDSHIEEETRICYWEYLWESIVASGQEYDTKVTYQVSIISDKSRCVKLIELKHKLDKLDIHPNIQIEYDNETRRWHSYFALEVLENV